MNCVGLKYDKYFEKPIDIDIELAEYAMIKCFCQW